MASTPQSITQKNLPVTLTTLYTAFTGGSATRAMLVSIDFSNTTPVDVTIDLVKETGGPVDDYIGKGVTVPASGVLTWRGLVTLATAGDLIRALCSVATSVDVTGTVMENA